jgi:hypothetical protein
MLDLIQLPPKSPMVARFLAWNLQPQRAFAPATEAAVRSDRKLFIAWCANQQLPSMPAVTDRHIGASA